MAAAASPGDVNGGVEFGGAPQVRGLVAQVGHRERPILEELSLVAEVPLLHVGGAQIDRNEDINALGHEGSFLGAAPARGNGLPPGNFRYGFDVPPAGLGC